MAYFNLDGKIPDIIALLKIGSRKNSLSIIALGSGNMCYHSV
jgi:hypothetical protein